MNVDMRGREYLVTYNFVGLRRLYVSRLKAAAIEEKYYS